jgi:dihydrofolate synthase/folylpolyglutamate synthase
VTDAIEFARKNAGADDLIFIGGSTFVVAEIEDL